MKKILTSKDEFVGRRMNEIICLDDYWQEYKLYMFNDAVLIEQRRYDGYSAMSEYDILQESVNVNVELDKINFDYKNDCCHSYKGHTIYNVKAIKVTISPFGKDLIAKGIIAEYELMEYGTKEAKKQIEDIEVKRERDIDECIAILAKYGIDVQL